MDATKERVILLLFSTHLKVRINAIKYLTLLSHGGREDDTTIDPREGGSA